MEPLGILLPVLLLSSFVTGNQYVHINDLDHHPMIVAAQESSANCPSNIDPNAYWMKKFLNLIKDRLPQQAVTWDDLLPNLRHLADLEAKGWLAAIAKGEKQASEIQWPNEALKPWLIPTYMPLVTPPQPEPVIVLEQIYNGKKMYKEIVGNQVRKKRDVNGEEMEEVEQMKQRAFHVNPEHFNDDLPYLGEKPDHDIHEPEYDDDGLIIGRKKRETPENMMVWPPPGTLFTVKRLCVKAHPNGTIIYPDPE
ncbi:hypothetical protein SK128_017880 [Halocaridina rubra]|uniref:Uncharacterized protein n=1 Tax=Halocaridina rubra TaxID=373956 RepID=A0AAN8WWU3_HALRR